MLLPWVKRWLRQHLYGLGLLIFGDHDKTALFSLFFLLPGVILCELSPCLVGVAFYSLGYLILITLVVDGLFFLFICPLERLVGACEEKR